MTRKRQSNFLPEEHSRNPSSAEAHASVSSFQGPFCHTPHRLLKPGLPARAISGAGRCVSAGLWEDDSRKGHSHMALLARRFGEPSFSGPPVTSDSSSQPRLVVHYRVDYWLSPSGIPTRPRRCVHFQKCRKEPKKTTARHILRATFTGPLAVMAGAAIPPSVNAQSPELVTFSRLPMERTTSTGVVMDGVATN